MPNINISGVQGAYKTSSMVYQMKRLIALYPEIYTADAIHTNLKLRDDIFPGFHYHNNADLRDFMKLVYAAPPKGEMGQHINKIIGFDEIDNTYTHLELRIQAVRDELLGCYQDEKFHNHFFYTLHRPSNVNKIIRDFTEVYMIPHHRGNAEQMSSLKRWTLMNAGVEVPSTEEVYLDVIDGRTRAISELPEPNIDRLWNGGSHRKEWYHREEAVI